MSDDEFHTSTNARQLSRRITVVGIALLLGMGGVWARLHHLQVTRHAEIARRVEDLHRIQRILPAHRGAVRDRNGELLAHDKTAHDLYVNTQQLRDLTVVRARLAKIEKTSVLELARRRPAAEMISRYRAHVVSAMAGMYMRDGGTREEAAAELAQLLSDEKRIEFPLLKGLHDDVAEGWRQLIEDEELVGLSLRSTTRRAYPCAERLTHVLGYVNHENEGQEGIEASFNDVLRGQDGSQSIERDRRGREITTLRGETVEPRNGHDVLLTIDMQLQELMEETLEGAFDYYKPRKIIAVLVEPRSGAIRAMASRPHFERTDMGGTLNNLAIGAQFEPGSVFKIVTYAAAFDRGLARLDETINCDPDQKIFANLNIHDHVSGPVTVAQAFMKSSNRGAYLISHRLGSTGFLDYVQKFGFGQKSGIPLTGEVAGHVPPHKSWDMLTWSRLAIGHAVAVTPLQMAMAVSAIANGGTLMKPKIVQEIRDDAGTVLESFTPEPVRRVCSERAAASLRVAMESVVSDKGTGAKAAIPGIRVAGKTGTAQLYTASGKGIDEGHYCVSFAGFAPAENPELCAIVVVDDPHAPHEELLGGVLAGPIFAQLMKQCLDQTAVARNVLPSRAAIAKGGAR
jgi:cell division protein FtsI/penicillin-binding protein 2